MPRPDAKAKLAASKPKEGPSPILLGGVIVVVAIIVAVVAVIMTRPDTVANAEKPELALEEGAGIPLYQDKAKADAPEVVVYEDFQCPACQAFEASHGPMLKELAQSGDIKLRYTTMNFLDQNHGNDASTRAGNASLCVAESGPDAYEKFKSDIFAAQDKQQQNDVFPDAFLKETAKSAGASDDVDACIDDKKYEDYVNNMNTKAGKDGVTSTPSIAVDGKVANEANLTAIREAPDKKALLEAVKKAQG